MFRQRWFEPHECWKNDKLASHFEALLELRSAFYTVISSNNPGSYDAFIACSSPLFELLRVILHFSFLIPYGVLSLHA